MTLYFTINSPHQWVSLDSKGIHDSGEVDSLSDLSFAGQRCVAVVPGEQVATRDIVLPVRSRQKLMAAIPFAIEDSLISRIDDLHFTLLNIGAENKVTFAYVSRDVLSGWLEQVNQAGISLYSMLPDYLLLPQATPSSAVISSSEDGRILLRSGLYQGAVTDLEKLSVWLQEQDLEMPLVVDRAMADQLPVELADRITLAEIGGCLTDWLSEGLPELNAVLLSGDFSQGKKRSRLRQYWPAVAMLALAGFIKLGSDISACW
jgi:general secretion pathway protein L